MTTRRRTKYYVESGPRLQAVVLAGSPLQAIANALAATRQDQPLRLADLFIVNQRGFVWNREGQVLYGDETVVPTRLLLGRPEAEIASKTCQD